MADTTEQSLRAHMTKWRGTAKRKGPGFNANPIDELREEVRWLCAELDRAKQWATAVDRRLEEAHGG